MPESWGIVGCAYMAKEYCKVLRAKGVAPNVYSRNLGSGNVQSFQALFPDIRVQTLNESSSELRNWIVCTNIESHDEICSMLRGQIYCEKPYAHTPVYDVNRNIYILMNRRYYYWVDVIQELIAANKIVKIIASVPEKSADALITQSIHVIDLVWYLTGAFGPATRVGTVSPSFVFSTHRSIPVVLNMNYGSHENFSIRFYGSDGAVYEAKPLEAFGVSVGMQMSEPDDAVPFRTYKPTVRPLSYISTSFKPGLSDLVDDLVLNSPTRLPTIEEHRAVHLWMADQMS